ncbi:MAG: ribosomal-processing cysteine protease Prp [Ruminococcus sp.]|nr:ribosomal-processing cysteine protease Prp [Ruminococcus sp.]
MISAQFFEKNGAPAGFSCSGHAGFAESGYDIVCASVSSAVQLTLNLLLDFKNDPDIDVDTDIISCRLDKSSQASERIINAFRLHLESIAEEFPGTIEITVSEV